MVHGKLNTGQEYFEVLLEIIVDVDHPRPVLNLKGFTVVHLRAVTSMQYRISPFLDFISAAYQ